MNRQCIKNRETRVRKVMIDETWLSKAAGWKAWQEGRKLLEQGKVVNASQAGPSYQAQVIVGGRPRPVIIKIPHLKQVDTHCFCIENQRNGGLCGHAVAALLSCLRQNQITATPEISKTPLRSVKTATIPFQVILSPRWLEAWQSGNKIGVALLHSKRSDFGASDHQIGLWLISRGIDATKPQPMLSLGLADWESFLLASQAHPEIFCQNQPLTIIPQTNRPILAESDAEFFLRQQPEEKYLKGKEYWWRAHTQEIEQSFPLHSHLSPLLNGEKMTFSNEKILNFLSEWGGEVDLSQTTLAAYRFTPAPFSKEAHIEGSGSYLEIHPIARYDSLRHYDMADEATNPAWPSLIEHQFYMRDAVAEKKELQSLTRLGFSPDHGEPTLRLRGQDEVLDFLSSQLSKLEKSWNINLSDNIQKILSKIEILNPIARVIGGHGDWFHVEIQFETRKGEKNPISATSIRQLIQSGKKHCKLPDGRTALLNLEKGSDLENWLGEANLQQERGTYRVSSRDLPSLQQIVSLQNEVAVQSQNIDPQELDQDLSELEAELPVTLREYQKAGVLWLCQIALAHGGGILADDMGLGKTLQSILTLKILRNRESRFKKIALVVAPTSLLGNWQQEFARFAPDLKVLRWHGQQRDEIRDQIAHSDVLLTSYGTLVRDLALFKQSDWGLVLCDEASVIKNPDSQNAKALIGLKAQAKFAISGTPVENSVRDLWSLFQFSIPGYLGSRKQFQERYEKPCQTPPVPRALLRRLHQRIDPFVLRRNKSDVAKDLPQKQEILVWCDLSNPQQEYYQRINTEGQILVENAKKQSAGMAKMQALAVLMKLRQCCCDVRLIGDKSITFESLEESSGKLTRFLDMLLECRKNNHKILVFSQFTKLLDLVELILKSVDESYLRLDGQTRHRDAIVAEFQQDDGPGVFLISLKAGGYGLNLTQADVVMHLDPWWNPAAEAQATDRAHRIGQTNPVTVYKFVSVGSVEEKIIKLQAQKRQISQSSLNDDELSAPDFDLDDTELEALLS